MSGEDIEYHLHGLSSFNSNISHYNHTGKEDISFDILLRNAQIGIAVVYITVCLVGVLGNGMTLYLIRAERTLLVTDIYICNLAISDMATLLTLPLLAIDMLSRNVWPFGWFVCKAMVSMVYMSICASVYIITCMTIDRFESILFATKMRGKRTKIRAKRILLIPWLIAVIYMLPAMYFATIDIGSMSINTVHLVHTIFRFTVVFLIPLVILLTCNISIITFLMAKDRKKKKNERKTIKKAKTMERSKKVAKMVVSVTVVFFLCWIPNLLSTTIYVFGPEVLQMMDNLFDPHYEIIFHWSTVCCLYLNSGLNPILYSLLSRNYKNKVKAVIQNFGNTLRFCCKTERICGKEEKYSTSEKGRTYQSPINSGKSTQITSCMITPRNSDHAEDRITYG